MTGYVGGDPYQSPTFGKSLSLRVDGGFNALSMNPSGRDAVLASRKGLYVINLDDPFLPPRWLYDKTPWQVADVQWCPHPAKPSWVVSTANQKAIIWDLSRSSSDAIAHVLHAHSRAITDVSFNFDHPNLIATSSIDTYIHAWDLRAAKRPFYTTTDWHSSASQVQWNFHKAHIMASSQGNDVYIWDLRMGSTYLHKLSDHTGSVNCIDFNRNRPTEIMTSSNDETVKFWDYSISAGAPLRTINMSFPTWRGRYSPFGDGFCVMPTVGGGNCLYMQNLDLEEEIQPGKPLESKLEPAHVFKGHTDDITEFVWRSRNSYDTDINDREYQLITWSKDCDLRLWSISDDIYEKMNFKRGEKLDEKLPIYDYSSYNMEPKSTSKLPKDNYKTRKETFVTTSGMKGNNDMNHITWLSGVKMNHSNSSGDFFKSNKYQNLGEEVSAIGHRFPKIVFEKISVSTGDLIITLNGPWSESNPEESIFMRIEVNCPQNYPTMSHPPTITIEENSNLSTEQKSKILNELNVITKKYTDLNLYCLEPCLRYLMGEELDLDELISDQDSFTNFELADKLYFEDFSSLASSDIASEPLSDISTDSENDTFGGLKDLMKPSTNVITNNELKFDSTPVPNECGAVWSPTGQLFCFFSNSSSTNKVQANFLKLRDKMHPKNYNRKNEFKPFNSDMLMPTSDDLLETSQNLRPKRYVDTIVASNEFNDSHQNSEADTDSFEDDSTDEYDDDWGDILKKDLNFKTNFSSVKGFFPKELTSLNSTSMGGLESLRNRKNCAISHDFSFLIPDRRELALEYEFVDKHPEELSRINASVSNRLKFDDISHCWQALSDLLMEQEIVNPYTLIWDNHPMGIRWFIKEIIAIFEAQKNLQMLAMFACVLANFNVGITNSDLEEENDIPKRIESVITFGHLDTGNIVNTKSDAQSHHSFDHRKTTSFSESQRRSVLGYSSPSDVVSVQSEDYFNFRATPISEYMPTRVSVRSQRNSGTLQNNPMYPNARTPMPTIKVELVNDDVIEAIKNPIHIFFDHEDLIKLQVYQYEYSKLLYSWRLPLERAKLLKIDISSVADTRNKYTQEKYSENDNPMLDTENTETIRMSWIESPDSQRDFTFKNCVLCILPARRNIFVCRNCQHIMHPKCANEWWHIDFQCPTGCGCNCPERFDHE